MTSAKHAADSAVPPQDLPQVRLRFFLPSAELSRYVTTYYHMEITPSGDGKLEDYLHPEWGNIRIGLGGDLAAGVGTEALAPVPRFVATGPTSLSTRFSVSSGRFWGIGLLPLGWLKFVNAPARLYADRFVDGGADPAFAMFAPLTRSLFGENADLDAEAKRIDTHMAALVGQRLNDEDAVTKVHSALVNTQIATVSELAEQADMSVRSLERFSRKAFGFTPKLLLRRQRFLRSLSEFMLDPSLSWLKTMDHLYHDQAHFVRDFKRFMSMTPNQYRDLPHPILMAAVRGRAEAAGQTMQGLHDPGTSS
ncbi:helix-turn-helix domain-containing protein [Pontixanthobacter aquaemixtae]|uniref:Helix-turn-helix domain-containing protein n=1 Tax=Pontixanthobacter aquaemixtae TaxID=1958940 RepID=A0A844ZWC6_9SPHN|nr:helix-turn-helix domain-containing protein [Pontixanthobacter aquaemixtae]MXO91256.1 helix-turn-helix domain-containing protein [Pontixanthobacter aquaemixtae]